jgi:hypothetical protein
MFMVYNHYMTFSNNIDQLTTKSNNALTTSQDVIATLAMLVGPEGRPQSVMGYITDAGYEVVPAGTATGATMDNDGTLSSRLRQIADDLSIGLMVRTHSEACWQWHDACALLLAADRLDALTDDPNRPDWYDDLTPEGEALDWAERYRLVVSQCDELQERLAAADDEADGEREAHQATARQLVETQMRLVTLLDAIGTAEQNSPDFDGYLPREAWEAAFTRIADAAATARTDR